MSWVHALLDRLFGPPPQPEGEYALILSGLYYTGRAWQGELLLNPDSGMACCMTLEQAQHLLQAEPRLQGFQIVPVVRMVRATA